VWHSCWILRDDKSVADFTTTSTTGDESIVAEEVDGGNKLVGDITGKQIFFSSNPLDRANSSVI
jgi:hypothetical protein